MKNWIKQFSWFSKEDRTDAEDEHSLFFAETLPGEPQGRRSVAAETRAAGRVKHVERPAKRE
jgi:hypothetical protein